MSQLKKPLLILIVSIAAGWALFFGAGDSDQEAPLIYEVKQEPFSSRVEESGVLRSLHSITISSSLPSNRAKIISLVSEGSYVQQGDLLVEFDDEPLLDDRKKFQVEIKELEGLLRQATEELRLQKLEGDKNLSSIQHEIDMAVIKNKKSKRGELLLKKREAQANLVDARNEWQRAQNEYSDLKSLLADGFVTKNEVEQARINASHAKNAYLLQQKKTDVLEKVAIPAEFEKARSEVSKRKKDLARQRKVTMYSTVRSQSVIDRTRVKLASARENLKTTEKRLRGTRILAPASGFVIFKEVPIIGERRKVHVGDSVWANQGFMVLPDISQMAVEIRVREVDIHKVRVGQHAAIRLDSYPDLELKGKVSQIGAIAETDANSGYRGGKFFRVNVLLDTTDKRLRPGMTARVDITVGEFSSALQIPINAVFRKLDKDYCYVWEDGPWSSGKASLRKIVTGISNENFIVVQQGLAAGEKVLLSVPEHE